MYSYSRILIQLNMCVNTLSKFSTLFWKKHVERLWIHFSKDLFILSVRCYLFRYVIYCYIYINIIKIYLLSNVNNNKNYNMIVFLKNLNFLINVYDSRGFQSKKRIFIIGISIIYYLTEYILYKCSINLKTKLFSIKILCVSMFSFRKA